MNFILYIGRHEHFCKMKKKPTKLKDSLRKTMKNLCWEIHALGQRLGGFWNYFIIYLKRILLLRISDGGLSCLQIREEVSGR